MALPLNWLLRSNPDASPSVFPPADSVQNPLPSNFSTKTAAFATHQGFSQQSEVIRLLQRSPPAIFCGSTSAEKARTAPCRPGTPAPY